MVKNVDNMYSTIKCRRTKADPYGVKDKKLMVLILTIFELYNRAIGADDGLD